MLNQENVRKIADFVKKHAALTGGREEGGADRYFRAVTGKSYNVATGCLTGVYCSDHPNLEDLIEQVEEHVVKTWEAQNGAPRVWLTVWTKAAGKKNADDFETLRFDDVAGPSRDSDDAIARLRELQETGLSGGTAFNSAAAITMLRTHDLLHGLVMDFAASYRLAADQNAEQRADLRIAEAMLQVVTSERGAQRMQHFFDRLDPHLAVMGPQFFSVLAELGQVYAATHMPIAPEQPSEPDAAADWHVQRFTQALFGLGAHFAANPATLTEERLQALVKLIKQLIERAGDMKTPTGESLMERVMAEMGFGGPS